MQRAMDQLFFRLGVYSAPNSAFRTPGASPTLLIVKLLWLSEGGKGRSPIALFAALNTSFKDQNVE